MEIILDTNALSAFADGDEGIRAVLAGAESLHLPSIVLGEFRFGILQSKHRRRYESWLAEMILNTNVLRPGTSTAGHYAEIRLELKNRGTPIPYHDIWIAALAREYALPVLTRDGHFADIPLVSRLDW
jgi:predicted nucleic acid-binding protein